MIFTVLAAAIGLSICVSLVKLGLWYCNSYRILLRSKCFRGPKALPFIGNAHLFTGKPEDIYEKIQEIMNKYQSPFRLWLGPFLYLCLQEPENIKLVLNNPTAMEKSPIYDSLKPLVGEGLLTAPVPKWKPHRQAIQPLFGRNELQSFIRIFESKASILAEKIGMEGKGTEIDIHHCLARYAFDSICGTTVGTSVNVLSENDSTLFDMVDSVLAIMIKRILTPWLYSDFIFKLTSTGQRLYKSVKYVRGFITKTLIDEKHDIQKELTTQPRKSLLGLLLTSPEVNYKFTDEEIYDEIATIIGGGYETSTTGLSLMLLMLAAYPTIQDKVYAEVCDTYGVCKSKGLDITIQDLDRMKYFDRVWKEVLRLFPVVPILSRTISEDINMGEYTLPAGSLVLINLPTIHRSEKYWLKPLEFNPDRFLPMHPFGPQHPCAYIPFSIGARNCIGSKYATVSAKILLATLLSKYIFKTTVSMEAKDIKMQSGIFLKTKDPIMLIVQRRFPEAY